jgi:hypothetical protein
MPTTDIGTFQYRGARALVILHERYMREFLATWRQFVASGAVLPVTQDADYATPQTVLRHVLRASRGYMVWICKNLGFPDPQIQATPEPAEIEAKAEAYLEHLLERWRAPLRDLTEERSGEEFKTRWGTTFSIDSMLEHAVVHPMRHTFQFKELMSRR